MDQPHQFSSSLQYHRRARFNLATTPESNILEDKLKFHKAQIHSSHSAFEHVNRSGRSTHASNRSMSSPPSALSLASLDLQMQETEEQMNMTRPISVIRDVLSGEVRNIRLGPLIHLVIVSCLIFGTLSDLVFRSGGGIGIGLNDKKHKLHDSESKSGILGSAMIESLSDALLPILPFAGGVDLRRDDAWKSWRNYLSIFGDGDYLNDNETANSRKKVKVQLIPRGGAIGKKGRNGGPTSAMVLSTTESFLPLDDIADMTLREISYTFHYLVESGKEEFHIDTFVSTDFEGEQVNSRMEKAVRSIDDAAKRSRGEGIQPALTSNEEGTSGDSSNGDIDALRFSAAMRILAEWRVLRQVPPGYKGYAVGMNLGQKDVVQNLAKIEHAAHKWIEARLSDGQCDDGKVCDQKRSPTLRQLLEDEIDNNVHPNNKLPRLKDKTAAMGLLWVRRQLHYQTAIFDNILSVPKTYATVIEAVSAAYADVYGSLHGWAVQKIFNYSFQAAPNAKEIFRHMNPRLLEEVKNSATLPSQPDNYSNDEMSNDIMEEIMIESAPDDIEFFIPKELKVEIKEGNPFLNFFENIGSEFDKLGHHIGGEWDKLLCNISNTFDKNKDEDCDNITSSSSSSLAARGGSSSQQKSSNTNLNYDVIDVEEHTSKIMQEDANQHIEVFLKIVSPMLDDLAALFDEMNMDDPTKV